MKLKKLGEGQGYLKAGFLGFQGTGKTYTAALLATATKKLMKHDGPIGMYDTEGGSSYLGKMVQELTGKELIGDRCRSLQDLIDMGQECVKAGVSVFIVDSITHPWREVCESYLKQVNEGLKKRGRPPRTKLEFQDWGPIKAKWAEWTDFYLNSPMHIIICGRAGFSYDMETNEDTNRKELVKTGTKMKTEAEFGFEPSLLVEMESEQQNIDGRYILHQTATVIKDRFNLINGAVGKFGQQKEPNRLQKELDAVTKFFNPHLSSLIPGVHAPINTESKTDLQVDENGDAEWQREKRTRTILAEEIQGELVRRWPGQTAEEKKAKIEALEKAFNTRSWTAISESTNSVIMREGLDIIRQLPTPGKAD